MRDYLSDLPIGVKAFYVMITGSVVQLLSEPGFVHLMGFLVAVAGFIVQVSAYMRNRAETKKAEEETRIRKEEAAREAEMHEAQMHFIRRGIERNMAADNEAN